MAPGSFRNDWPPLSAVLPKSDPADGPSIALSAPSNWRLIQRMFALSWPYRWWCVALLVLQGLMLLTAMLSLRLAGLGFDVIRFASQTSRNKPPYPPGLHFLESWDPFRQVLFLAGGIVLSELLRAALHSTYLRTAGHLVHERIVVDLRARVYDKLQRLSFGFFDGNATGSIINRVTSDVQSVRSFVDGVLIQFVILALSLVCYISYMSSIHVGLTLACLATTPLMWLITVLFSRVVRPMYDRNRDLVDKVILRLAESIQGVQVIKGFGRERDEIAQFNRANEEVRDQQQDIFYYVSVFSPLVGFMTQLNLIILLAYGGWLVTQDLLPLGSGLVVFAGLLQQYSSQVANLTNIANNIQQCLSGARRVFEVLDAPVAIESKPNAVRLPKVRGHICFENVWFEYRPGLPVVQDVSFEVLPGEKVALLGTTGAGKTTLLSLLCRFHDPTRGRITLDGIDLRDIDVDDLRRSMGIVFQETFLFSNSVAANIAFGNPFATPAQIEAAARVASADEFIRELPQGYDTILGEFGLDLSGGQRQRIAIARAVLLDPALLLLDDPAAAIDPHTEHDILNAMQQAMQGRTTFVVAHRLSTLRNADLVLVLEQGRISESGSHAELMDRRGHYRNIADLQTAGRE